MQARAKPFICARRLCMGINSGENALHEAAYQICTATKQLIGWHYQLPEIEGKYPLEYLIVVETVSCCKLSSAG